jgi:hypothetical protein
VSKDSKYSVLFMRDDSRVKRFRMSPFWLKVFFYFQVFLVAYAVLATFLALRFLQTSNRLAQEKQEVETMLADASVQLERLQKVRDILASYEDNEVQSLLNAPEAVKAPPPADADASASASAVSLSRIFQRKDTGRADVEDFSARINGRRVAMSFSLNNLLPSEEPISGRAVVKLVLDNGEQRVLPTNPEVMSYLIQRYKRVDTSARLPSGVSAGDVFGLRLLLQSSNGNTILSELHPLDSPLQ